MRAVITMITVRTMSSLWHLVLFWLPPLRRGSLSEDEEISSIVSTQYTASEEVLRASNSRSTLSMLLAKVEEP